MMTWRDCAAYALHPINHVYIYIHINLSLYMYIIIYIHIYIYAQVYTCKYTYHMRKLRHMAEAERVDQLQESLEEKANGSQLKDSWGDKPRVQGK